MSCKYLKSKIEEFQCSDGLKTTETFTCSLFESTDPTTATNIGCKMAETFKQLTGNTVVLNGNNAPCYFHTNNIEDKCPYFEQ